MSVLITGVVSYLYFVIQETSYAATCNADRQTRLSLQHLVRLIDQMTWLRPGGGLFGAAIEGILVL